VINCNLGPISHRFRDMASYWFKIAKFSYPLSFRALDWGDPHGIFGKALQILKLESLGQRWWRFDDPSLHLFCLIHPWDRRTDGRTDRSAVARKNCASVETNATFLQLTLPSGSNGCQVAYWLVVVITSFTRNNNTSNNSNVAQMPRAYDIELELR